MFSPHHATHDAIRDALLETDGTALASDSTSFVYAERNAEAVLLAYLWGLIATFAHQHDPSRTTQFLPRWEKILGLRPLATDTDVDRRKRVKAKVASFALPGTAQVVSDILLGSLGNVFLGVVNTTPALAVGFVPGGFSAPGGVTLPSGGFYSTIAHLALATAPTIGMDDPTFYAAVGQIAALLDDVLPAWVVADWFRDGPSGAGFILDDPHNLDNERFDS